ncbi:MAG TPA: UDP-2,3-diacylglucosamine diphosphatase LpxI [Phycisphaerae bacterium]|nr:UDP-2,3-diacylglucosamine diphosphatase LpxI [Phycisphaerae bacterium]
MAGEPPVGMIAGYGRPPFLVANGIRQAGRSLAVVGLRGLASPRLRDMAEKFTWCGITRVGHWGKALRKWGVRQTVMIGAVRKREIYSPLRFFRHIPDFRTAWLWYFKVRKDKRDNAVLLAVADELRKDGVELMPCVEYCREHLASEGLMTRTPIPGGAEADVEFGWRIAKASADLDIGQTIAVRERDIIAVEAVEGTDTMIRRAGRLCRVGGWTMIKVARSRQDMRFDVPTVGPSTLRNLNDARCVCLVVEAGKTLIVDKPTTLELADRLGIAVVGVRGDDPQVRGPQTRSVAFGASNGKATPSGAGG